MRAITPNTNLKLLKVPIELDNNNQIKFASKQAQYNYFNNCPKIEFDDFTYQRQDFIVRVPMCIDDILEYNYVMYQNEHYSDKWFYAFIEDMTFISTKMTAVKIKTDVYQTWQHDLVFKRSFVEREHVSNDTVGLHTVPEVLETGDYIICDEVTQEDYADNTYICIALSDDIFTPVTGLTGNTYNGVYSGLTYIIVQNSTQASLVIKEYNDAGKIDAINFLFLIPRSYVATPSWIQKETATGSVTIAYVPQSNSSTNLGTTSVSVPTHVGKSYTPKNNKLFCFPYSYLIASNNAGTDVVYHYEDFRTRDAGFVGFQYVGNIIAGCAIKCVPTNYKNVENNTEVTTRNYEEGFNCAKLPLGSWTNDVYRNWLAQNSLNISMGIIGGTVQSIGGVGIAAVSGGEFGISSVTGGINKIVDTVASQYQHSLIPDQVNGNVNSSDVMFGVGRIEPTFYNMSVKDEYAKIIDNYFSMYGYKVNELKTPNLTGRRNWNFIKTINANIEGYIPQKHLQEIKQMFDSGVTLWHNPATFLDYSQNNDII